MKARYYAAAIVATTIAIGIAFIPSHTHAMRLVNTVFSPSGASGQCFGVCCQPPANGGTQLQCTDFAALADAGQPWPSDWPRDNVMMAGALASGNQNLGCSQATNAVLSQQGAALTASYYDGGPCQSSWDASAITPNGYGVESHKSTGVAPPFVVTYTASYPSGAGSCEGGTGNCLDVAVLTEYQTYSAGHGWFDGGGVNTLWPTMPDTWTACQPAFSPYANTGVCHPPPYWVENDYHEHYAGNFYFSLYKNNSAILNNQAGAEGTNVMQKYWIQTIPATSLIDHLPNDASVTISSPDAPGVQSRMFSQMEIRTIAGYAHIDTAYVGQVYVCTPGDGGPCF